MSRRRIVLLLVLLACALPLGAWLVAGPAWPSRGAAGREPPIDLGESPRPPLDGARPAAAPRREDPALLVAAATAPRSASEVDAAERARCGEDQSPEFAPPAADEDGLVRSLPVQTKPPGVGFVGAQRRVEAALRATGDPFDNAVADALNVDNLRSLDDRLATVVQDAVGSDDPRLYELAFSTCDGAPTSAQVATGFRGVAVVSDAGKSVCGRLDPRQWAGHDPGNAAPWLYALEQADARRDKAAQREALQHLAAASRFDVRLGAASAAVARQRLAEADLAGQTALAAGIARAEALPPFAGVMARCRNIAGGDAEMAATCGRIAALLFDRSDTSMGLLMGGSLHRLISGDASWLDRAHRELRDASRLQADATETASCKMERQMLRRYVRVGEVGELRALREAAASAPQGAAGSR